jgi:hypothetical protein
MSQRNEILSQFFPFLNKRFNEIPPLLVLWRENLKKKVRIIFTSLAARSPFIK